MDYVVALKVAPGRDIAELAAYLAALTPHVDVLVIDGSDEPVYVQNERVLGTVRHMRPDPRWRCANGKVAGVLTGLQHAVSAKVVLADDDVRYTVEQLARLDRALDDAEVVRPQNYFDELPWHARWDTARTLINRCFGADYPGTLGVRPSAALVQHGYDGSALFENLELIRTVKALGGRESVALDLLVARRPPVAAHFRRQRIRQAYDSHAQPLRLAAELAILPLTLWAVTACKRPARAGWCWLAGPVLAAEVGRRRGGGRTVFAPTAPCWAPLWLLERSCCAWVAGYLRLSRRGVSYGGKRFLLAANSQRRLNRRFAGCA